MHLAFVSGLLALFLKPLLGKKGAALGGLVFILAYIFLVGPQPSLVRAGIMYVLGALSMLGGMGRRPILALAAAFCLQTLWDPSSALGPSFVLSYTALAGILLLSDSFAVPLRGRFPKWLAQPLAASLGAFCFTAPAVIAFFGILRPVGIAAGLAVVPLVSLFMALAGSSLLIGFIPPIGYVLDLVLNLVQELLNRMVYLASLAPGVELSFPIALVLFPLCIGLVLIAGGYCRNYRSRLAPFA
jgi:competence protein ComEC